MLALVDRFIYTLYDASVTGIKLNQELNPNLFALYAPEMTPEEKIDYPVVGYPMQFSSPDEKQTLMQKIAYDMASTERNMVCSVFVGEAWAVSHSPEEYETAMKWDGGIVPGMDPNRFEILVICAMTYNNKRKLLTFKIEKDPLTGARTGIVPCEVAQELANSWIDATKAENMRYEDTILTNVWKDYGLKKILNQMPKMSA